MILYVPLPTQVLALGALFTAYLLAGALDWYYTFPYLSYPILYYTILTRPFLTALNVINCSCTRWLLLDLFLRTVESYIDMNQLSTLASITTPATDILTSITGSTTDIGMVQGNMSPSKAIQASLSAISAVVSTEVL